MVVRLLPGDAAPFFKAPASNNPVFSFDTVAGRYIVLSFFGSAATALGRDVVAGFMAHADLFNDDRACFFGVSADPRDRAEGRVQQRIPGSRFFWDFERTVADLYGAVDAAGAIVPQSFLLDPMLRIIAVLSIDDPAQHVARMTGLLRGQRPAADFQGAPSIAPATAITRSSSTCCCRATTIPRSGSKR